MLARMAHIESIQIGKPRRLEPVEGELSKRGWTTAFHKQPVDGPVWASRTGLEGDEVAERRVHGGPDKAMCVYPADRLPHWRGVLGEADLGPAPFGENLSVAGMTEEDVCLGDVWRVGDAVLEVSQPRQPCWKLARRWKRKELSLLVQETGYTGWYVRVAEEGALAPGDPIELAQRPHADWTIARANDVMYEREDAVGELIDVRALAASWKRQLQKRLD
ncbi:MAG: MOSC domain-containing protein [Planctomycetota bacterium]